jgi:UDPglucose 6-dehydrogenase
MRVGIFGTGHVGLPTAAALAYLGHDVVATDVDAEKLSALSVGRLPFYEPDLEDSSARSWPAAGSGSAQSPP